MINFKFIFFLSINPTKGLPKDVKGGGICEKPQIPPPVVYRYNGLKTAPDD